MARLATQRLLARLCAELPMVIRARDSAAVRAATEAVLHVVDAAVANLDGGRRPRARTGRRLGAVSPRSRRGRSRCPTCW